MPGMRNSMTMRPAIKIRHDPLLHRISPSPKLNDYPHCLPHRPSSSSRLRNRAIAAPTSLDIIRVYPRRATRRRSSLKSLLTAIVVDILQVKRVYVARKVSQEGQTDIDEQVCSSLIHIQGQRRGRFRNHAICTRQAQDL